MNGLSKPMQNLLSEKNTKNKTNVHFFLFRFLWDANQNLDQLYDKCLVMSLCLFVCLSVYLCLCLFLSLSRVNKMKVLTYAGTHIEVRKTRNFLMGRSLQLTALGSHCFLCPSLCSASISHALSFKSIYKK